MLRMTLYIYQGVMTVFSGENDTNFLNVYGMTEKRKELAEVVS
jgi:hypothetical protein